VLDVARTTRSFCAKTQRDRARYQYMIPSFLLHTDARSVLTEQGIPLEGRKEIAKEPLSKEEIQKLQPILKAYRSTDEQRELLKAALKKYEGTHPFHNFTKGLKPGQASANRYIESFRVQDPVIIDGVEWIPTQVLGQSFLLNQIRKMISMAVDVARGVASLEAMDKALTKMTTLRVSLAPAQGLFLEMSYYGGYNKRKAQNKELPDLDWTVEGPATDRWEAFRNTIRKHIVEEEALQGNFLQYFYQQECIFKYKLSYDEPEKGGEDETTYKDAEK
jgi:tRNA pseudouridine(38-40) synthase